MHNENINDEVREIEEGKGYGMEDIVELPLNAIVKYQLSMQLKIRLLKCYIWSICNFEG